MVNLLKISGIRERREKGVNLSLGIPTYDTPSFPAFAQMLFIEKTLYVSARSSILN